MWHAGLRSPGLETASGLGRPCSLRANLNAPLSRRTLLGPLSWAVMLAGHSQAPLLSSLSFTQLQAIPSLSTALEHSSAINKMHVSASGVLPLWL